MIVRRIKDDTIEHIYMCAMDIKTSFFQYPKINHSKNKKKDRKQIQMQICVSWSRGGQKKSRKL